MTIEQLTDLFEKYILGLVVSNFLNFILLVFIALFLFSLCFDKSEDRKEKQNKKVIENTIKEYLSKNGK